MAAGLCDASRFLPRLSWKFPLLPPCTRCLPLSLTDAHARSLASCFAELPALQGISYASASERNGVGNGNRTAAVPEAPPVCALLALPRDVLRRMMRGMAPPDVRALSGTCGLMRDVARDAMPGLLLDLFPHQARLLVLDTVHSCCMPSKATTLVFAFQRVLPFSLLVRPAR